MKVRVLATVVCACWLAGCFPNAKGAHYAVGFSIANGAAVVEPTVERGTTAMLSYHEKSGAVTRVLLLLMGALGAVDITTKIESRGERGQIVDQYHPADDGEWVTTTKTTTVTENEEGMKRLAASLPGIMMDDLGIETNISIAMERLGGDTSGASIDMIAQLFQRGKTAVAVGFGYGKFTFHDRTYRESGDPGTGVLTTREGMGDFDYRFMGSPLRAIHAVTPFTSLFVQWDLNWLTLMTGRPSPLHAGVIVQASVLQIKATVTTERVDVDSLTLGVEAIVGF